MHDAATISAFCERVASFANKLHQYQPLQRDPPAAVTKFYKFAETLAATRRSAAKTGNNTVSAPSSTNAPAEASASTEPRGRKVRFPSRSVNRIRLIFLRVARSARLSPPPPSLIQTPTLLMLNLLMLMKTTLWKTKLPYVVSSLRPLL